MGGMEQGDDAAEAFKKAYDDPTSSRRNELAGEVLGCRPRQEVHGQMSGAY
jgi:hypothetical protein